MSARESRPLAPIGGVPSGRSTQRRRPRTSNPLKPMSAAVDGAGIPWALSTGQEPSGWLLPVSQTGKGNDTSAEGQGQYPPQVRILSPGFTCRLAAGPPSPTAVAPYVAEWVSVGWMRAATGE